MRVPVDGIAWAGWALRENDADQIDLATMCETADQARELRRQMRIRQPHRPVHELVAVRVVVTEVD